MQNENLGARFQPRLFAAIPAEIIETIDGERRVSDIELRKILGNKGISSFRLGLSHRLQKLEKFGLIVRRGGGGDDEPLYWFNEAQTTYLIFKSGLPAPNELVDDIIRTCPTFATPTPATRDPVADAMLRATPSVNPDEAPVFDIETARRVCRDLAARRLAVKKGPEAVDQVAEEDCIKVPATGFHAALLRLGMFAGRIKAALKQAAYGADMGQHKVGQRAMPGLKLGEAGLNGLGHDKSSVGNTPDTDATEGRESTSDTP